MSNERNNEIKEGLDREIEALRAGCVNACQVIENNPPDIPILDPKEVAERTNRYIKGLQIAAHNSNTVILSDNNLIIMQFLNEIKEKVCQIKELAVYINGCVKDVETETNRLRNLITIAKEAQSKELNYNKSQVVEQRHVENAAQGFRELKMFLRDLLELLHPSYQQTILAVLGEFTSAKNENNASGYLPVTEENAPIIELLLDLKIVTLHPYDKKLAKLMYCN